MTQLFVGKIFFYVTVSLRILSSFVFDLHCLLCMIQNLSSATSYFYYETFFSRIFPGIILKGKSALMQESFRSEVSGSNSNVQKVESYLWWTYQINSHSYMNENILNLKYLDNTMLTAVFVKRNTFCSKRTSSVNHISLTLWTVAKCFNDKRFCRHVYLFSFT